MNWWTELGPTGRELIQMLVMFFGVTFAICGGAWATDWWQRRRK